MVAVVRERERPEIQAKWLPETGRLPAVASAAHSPGPANVEVHGAVMKGVAALYAGVIAPFGLTLGSDPEAAFMVAISAGYLSCYLGTPYILLRVARSDPGGRTLGEFLSEPFETRTGVITGREAAIQILMIPATLAFGAVGMCAAIIAAR